MFENENSNDTGINVEVVQTYNNENRDWLRVEMLDTESHTINIGSILNPRLAVLEFKGVDIERADTVVFWSDSEKNVDDSAEITVWARAQDEDRHPVFGTGFDWTYDEEPGLETGDLYTYLFNRNKEATLSAAMGEATGSIVIHGDAGYVDNSNDIEGLACSSQGGVNVLLLLLSMLFMVRRRLPEADGD